MSLHILSFTEEKHKPENTGGEGFHCIIVTIFPDACKMEVLIYAVKPHYNKPHFLRLHRFFSVFFFQGIFFYVALNPDLLRGFTVDLKWKK